MEELNVEQINEEKYELEKSLDLFSITTSSRKDHLILKFCG